MKTHKRVITFAVLGILGVGFLLLFFTRSGLRLQYLTVARSTLCPHSYLRYLAHRLASTGDASCQRYGSELLFYLARIDLAEARNIASEAIESTPDAGKYRLRAEIYMSQKNFTNAVQDYEEALRLANPLDWTGDFSIRNVSNTFGLAKICAQAQSRESASKE